jgi:hypothetical protein
MDQEKVKNNEHKIWSEIGDQNFEKIWNLLAILHAPSRAMPDRRHC